MSTKLGIVGPKDTVDQVIKVGETFFNKTTFVPLIYEYHEQILDLVKNNLDRVNCLLFTGITPYKIAKFNMDLSMPIEFIPREVIILYKIFFDILHSQKCSIIKNLSIDSFNEHEIQEFIKELTLPIENFYVLEDCSDDDEVVNFHEELYKKGLVDICLTTTFRPYVELQKNGLAVKRIIPTNQSIKKSLELLFLKIDSHRSEAAQISIGIINIDNFKKIIKERPSEYQLQKIKLKLHETLLGYCEHNQSTLVYNGSDEFLIFTTLGSLKNKGTKQDFDCTLVKLINDCLQISVSYGLGLGYTANEAMNNARIALEQAKLNGGNCAFLRHIDRTIVGPLMSSNHNEPVLKPKLIEYLSTTTKIVPSTLTKVIHVLLQMGEHQFDAREFSQKYSCSLRTSHRILSALTKAKVINILSYDQSHNIGRPYRLYKVNLEMFNII